MTMAWIAKATAIVGVAWLVCLLLRRHSAAIRFATLATALTALLALPLVELVWHREAAPPRLTPAVAMASAAVGEIRLGGSSGTTGALVQDLWMAGVVLMMLHVAVGHALSARRRTTLVPMTIGVLRPRVVLPAGASAWSDDLRRSVLLHEEGHIARRDPIWNLLMQVTRAVYWFHPLVWLVGRPSQVERERARDDNVLAAGVRPSDYATHLMTCAQGAGRGSASAGLPMASRFCLADRVERVVSPAVKRTRATFGQRAALAAGGGALLLPLAAFGSMSVQVRSVPMISRFVLPILAAASAGQAAELSGRIYDASNATVPKAQVIVRDQASAAEFKGVSGPAGEYSFTALPAGTYEMEVLMPGFARHQRRGLRLTENARQTVSVILKLGEVQETVQVLAPGQARPQQPREPQRIRVGGSVRPVRLLKQTPAVYPEAARAGGREGTVTLRAVIGVDGKIVNVSVLPGADADLAAAAEQAVRQWMYEPTLLNGNPVETVTTVEVSFRLGAA